MRHNREMSSKSRDFRTVLCHAFMRRVEYETWCNEREEGWWKFHQENPHVFEKWMELTNNVYEAGFRNYGGPCVYNVIRYHTDISAASDGPYNLDDHHIPLYSRLANTVLISEGKLPIFEIRLLQGEEESIQEIGFMNLGNGKIRTCTPAELAGLFGADKETGRAIKIDHETHAEVVRLIGGNDD